MARKDIVRQVAEKQDDGTLASYQPIGALFENVIDGRSNKGNYTLAQFFDNYQDFMKNADFIYCGENTPTNTRIKVWIDTSKKNSDEW